MQRFHRATTYTFVFIALFLFALFIWRALIPFQITGGDTPMYLGPYSLQFIPPVITYHLREPGAIWLFETILPFSGIDRSEIELTMRNGFSWFSPIFGAFFTVFVVSMSLLLYPKTLHRMTFGLFCFAGIYVWTFPGHIEFYAPFITALTLLVFTGVLIADGRIDRKWFWFAWVLACTIHRVALFVTPAYYFLLPTNETVKFRTPKPADIKFSVCALLALVIPHVLIILMYANNLSFGSTFITPMEIDNKFAELITPLTQAQADYVRANSPMGSFHLFTLGSALHWKHFLFFLFTSAPFTLMTIAKPPHHWSWARWFHVISASARPSVCVR